MRENVRRLDAQDTTESLLCELKRAEQQIHDGNAERIGIIIGFLGLLLLVAAIASWPAWGWLLLDLRFRWFMIGVGSTVLTVAAALWIGVSIAAGAIRRRDDGCCGS